MRHVTPVLLAILLSINIVFAEEKEALQLGEVVVTATREAEPLKEKPQTVDVIKEEEIKDVKPSHPSEIMNQMPGVWFSITGGEGHKTAIRQPLTTGPVYLYLEDGIPVRSTGFFNHNALYEINIPGADRIEVTKGTGTALYGSDAIGGTINVLTRPSPVKPEIEINPEIGEYDWHRLLASGGNTWGNDGFRLDLNNTHTDGWREHSQYDRYSTTLRWDHFFSDSSLKTILSYSNIDQETSGSSGLSKTDFKNRPSYNYQTFDFRKVEAFRLSTTFEKDFSEKGLLSLIPYMRWNKMDLLPGWGIFKSGSAYKGYRGITEFYSLGLLAKYRQDFEPMRSRLIVGIDIDYSPGKYREESLNVTRDASSFKYTSYTVTGAAYDYDATFTGISPYAQMEFSPLERLRFTLGARYDNMGYDYDNHLSVTTNRPASAIKSFSQLSPKAGLTYAFTKDISGFLSYNYGFRVPSSGDIFRASGTATTAIDLKPVRVDSYELGFRGKTGIFSFDTALFYMEKKDDIVTYKPAVGDSQRLNAGKTEHRGIEVGLGIQPFEEFGLNVSYSYAKHTYKEWKVSPTVDYSGKEMSTAPRQMLNARLNYKPIKDGLVMFEWVHLGSYWMDDANTEKYSGYDLFNLRASYRITPQWEIYAKVINLTDKLYASEASKSSSSETQYAPGQPRTFFAGVTYHWGGKQ